MQFCLLRTGLVPRPVTRASSSRRPMESGTTSECETFGGEPELLAAVHS